MSKATATARATPYCSVCHSAGKSKAEYSSHYLRESKAANAKTTCPYLLAITCGYCKGQGHTPKYCPLSKQKQAQAVQQTQQQEQKQALATPPPAAVQAPNAPKKVARNKFALLQDVMDEEERIAEQAVKDAEKAAIQAVKDAEQAAIKALQDQQKMREHQTAFPLIANEIKTKSMSGHLTGWSAIAAKPKQTEPKQTEPKKAQAQQAQPKKAQAQQTEPSAKAQEIDAPFDDMNPEMTKHFRKTIAAMFKVEDEKVEEEGNKYSCGFSWAD